MLTPSSKFENDEADIESSDSYSVGNEDNPFSPKGEAKPINSRNAKEFTFGTTFSPLHERLHKEHKLKTARLVDL